MGRRVCLAIGVSTVTPPVSGQALSFAYLDGAVLAARSMGKWAERADFGKDNIRVVDDEPKGFAANPVTRERVQQAVDELFPPGAEVVDHLILLYCGHGLTGESFGSISWLFSDALRQKYRVMADLFYEELLLHGVKRITLISDACREAPHNLDLMRLDGVRGIVVQGSQIDSPRFDRLVSCQDGQVAYMVSEPASAEPGKCVFSGVIADVLWGQEPSAIVNGMITTTSLGICVRARTTARASDYHLKLNPQCVVDPESAVLYDNTTPLHVPDDFQRWPSPSNGVAPGPAMAANEQKVKPLVQQLETAEAADVVRQRLEQIQHPGTANLIVWGNKVTLWSASPVKQLKPTYTLKRFQVEHGVEGTPVLVEFADGRFTPVVPYTDLYSVVAPDPEGNAFQAYGVRGAFDKYLTALEAIDDFAAGRLRVEDLDRLAADLRLAKHADPMLGVICAYLYRATADYDNIRRMACFYVAHNQPVPFDIALLGAMRVTREEHGALRLHVPAVSARASRQGDPALPDYATQATPAVEASIGGRCPWLGLGWDYVRDPRSEWAALVTGLADHASVVPRRGSTVLPRASAEQLAKTWGLTSG